MKTSIILDYIKNRYYNCNKLILKKSKSKIDNKEISIAICTNKKFINQAIALVKSMININSNINLYVLNIELDKNDIFKLKQISPDNVKIIVVNINEETLRKLPSCNKWPIEAWARILISQYILDDIILYLDVDCIIADDISELFLMDYSKYLIAGVKSPIAMKRSKEISCDSIGINSGVCMMNLKKMREFNFIDKIIDYALQNRNRLVMPDQDSINYVCKGYILNIMPKYNLMNICLAYNHKYLIQKIEDTYYDEESYEEARVNPKIIHFNGGPFKRPWENGIGKHPYKKIYFKYLNK